MKLAFYKAPGNLIDRAIRWWTSSPYSHCELVFRDGMFFSADAREGKVRYKAIVPDASKGDFVELQIDQFDENKLRRWCDERVGRGYDWWGIILSHVVPIGIEDPRRYFCSEICVAGLQQIGKLQRLKPSEIDPGELAEVYGL